VSALSNARRLCVIGLSAGAVGIAILYVSGVEMPVVPPGLVLLVVAAVAVANARGRWVVIVGTVVAIAEIAGIFASDATGSLFVANMPGVLTGSWIRLLGVLLATVAGVVAGFTRPVHQGSETLATGS